MKLIILKKGGITHSVQISALRALLLVALTGGLFAGAGAVGYRLAPVDGGYARELHQALFDWDQHLRSQRSELAHLADNAEATSEAVGRQLAGMQARLLRMEAIGTRVVEVADLDTEEFDFADAAPQGGPAAREVVVPLRNLQDDLDRLSVRLAGREQEIAMLESFLSHKEYRDGVAVRGRPVKWGWLSSKYGSRVDPISGKKAWHAGVDFAGRDGSDVVAVASGVVTFAGSRYGYGEMVEINHGDGYSTRYGHHQSLNVKSGDIVKKGQVIGLMGSSGRSTGPHVHLEVLKDGRTVDPAAYVASRK